MKKFYLRILHVFILLSLLFAVFWKVGVNSIIEVFVNLNPIWLIPFVVIYLSTKLMAALNLALLFKAIKKKVSYLMLLKFLLLTNAVALFFPSRTGELSLPILLKKHKNFDYGEVLSVQLIDKLITFVFFGGLALFGLIFLFDLSNNYLYILIFTLVLLVCVGFAAWSDKFRFYVKKYVLRKYSKYFRNFSSSFKYAFRNRKKYLIVNFFVTLSLLVVTFMGGVFVFLAFGQEVSLLHVAMIQAVVTMITLLPIPFSGLGLKEISGIYMYGIIGVPYAVSVNYFLFNFLFKYIFGSVVYGIFNKEFLGKKRNHVVSSVEDS